MTDKRPLSNLISAEMVAEWRQACAEIDREIVEKRQQRDKLAAMIENALGFVSATSGQQIAASPPRESSAGGTLKALVECYRTDERSPYRKLRHATRQNYDTLLRRLSHDCPDELSALTPQRLDALYADWKGSGKVAMAHSLASMLRGLTSFGGEILHDEECDRISMAIRRMAMESVKSHRKPLKPEHALKIRRQAHKSGLHSIALAQAFQFDCKLNQRDVIGEWVPQSEADGSDKEWQRGLRWNDIDADLILRLPTSKREIDLRLAPMVVEELGLLREIPKNGPVIISEITQTPWTTYEFRRQWRKLARAAGLPDNVYNSDSRVERDPSETTAHDDTRPVTVAELPTDDASAEESLDHEETAVTERPVRTVRKNVTTEIVTLVRRAAMAHNNSFSPAQVVNIIQSDPKVSHEVRNSHPNYPYTVIKRMLWHGHLTKTGTNRYSLTEKGWAANGLKRDFFRPDTNRATGG